MTGAAHQGDGGVASASEGGQDPKAHGQQEGLHAGPLHLARPGAVAGGQVADLVSDHPLKLIGVFRLQDQACEESHGARRGEGVELTATDQQNLDAVGVDAGRFQNGPGIGFKNGLDLGVPDQGHALLTLLGLGGEGGDRQDGCQGEPPGEAPQGLQAT